MSFKGPESSYAVYFDEIVEHCNELADWFIARHRGEPATESEKDPADPIVSEETS